MDQEIKEENLLEVVEYLKLHFDVIDDEIINRPSIGIWLRLIIFNFSNKAQKYGNVLERE
jgi:hypothetical protein